MILGKIEMVAAHGKGVVKTGVETLQAARGVVASARREATQVLGKTRDELKKTLMEGAARIGHQLSHIATPTHKEQADAHKAEIKAKKRGKRAPPVEGGEATAH
jgi:hypothetical protein